MIVVIHGVGKKPSDEGSVVTSALLRRCPPWQTHLLTDDRHIAGANARLPDPKLPIRVKLSGHQPRIRLTARDDEDTPTPERT